MPEPSASEALDPVDRWSLPILEHTRDRNIPPAQRFLRDGGLCSCFWRLDDGTPVLCVMPTGVPHDHRQASTTYPTDKAAGQEASS